jgi:hypothetical protein
MTRSSVTSLAIARDPIFRYAKGRSLRSVRWVKNSRGSWKSFDSLGLCEREGPGGATVRREGRLRQKDMHRLKESTLKKHLPQFPEWKQSDLF